MKIIYQNQTVETNAKTVLEFLKSKNTECSNVIIELNGKVYCNIDDINLSLSPDATLNVFKIVGGG